MAREAAARARTSGRTIGSSPPARWPFERRVVPEGAGPGPVTIVVPDLHHAFPAGQTAGTRLVLTQSTYQLQRWLDWLEAHPNARVVAHAGRPELAKGAPEASARRGPWTAIERIELDGDEEVAARADPDAGLHELQRAFRSAPVEERLAICRRAVASVPGEPALHLALASACMELEQLPESQAAIEQAVAIAPDWEAPWFEYGKLWLRGDDLERAADRFAKAARLMPSFSAALSNLGAALAEIDKPDAAIAALEQALRYDPSGYPILNNLGVIYREQGRLDEAIEVGRRVIGLAPDFVFGRYNLGHALFLQGRFEEARDVYADAWQRDPAKNPVQAGRLAVVRSACGEAGTAAAELERLARVMPEEAGAAIFEEAEATLEALLQGPRPGDRAVSEVLDVVRRIKKGGPP
jgi:tetratricopeptide (TPR) repeat protein